MESRTRLDVHTITSAGFGLRIGACLILLGLVAGVALVSSTATSIDRKISRPGQSRENVRTGATGLSTILRRPSSLSFLPAPPPAPTVEVFASDCTTPQNIFNVQDTDKTVCAKVTGADPSWRIIWSNSNFVAVQNVAVGSGTSTFTLSTSSSVGDWRVILFDPFGGTVQ